MILHIYTIIFCIISIEIIKYFNLFNKFKINQKNIKKILKIFKSKKISEHWKEIVIKKYSLLLFLNSLKILAIFSLIIIIFSIINYFDSKFAYYLLSTPGIIETTIFVIVYFFIRKFINAKL